MPCTPEIKCYQNNCNLSVDDFKKHVEFQKKVINKLIDLSLASNIFDEKM